MRKGAERQGSTLQSLRRPLQAAMTILSSQMHPVTKPECAEPVWSQARLLRRDEC